MATLTAKDVGHVEKLSGTNFPFWKFQISFVLRQHGLMDIVLGKEACPIQISITTLSRILHKSHLGLKKMSRQVIPS